MEITRGDNKSFRFQRKTKDNQVIKELVDEMYITFKRNIHRNEALFQKRLGANTIKYDAETNYYSFEILPEDTDKLEYKKYVYDIQIIKNGKKKTIHKGELNITYEVTYSTNEVI